MNRALMFATTASMIQQFNMDNIRLLQSLGYEVDVICNFEVGNTISQQRVEKFKVELETMKVSFYHIPITRKITDIKNIILSIRKSILFMNENKYDLIHCHTPIGSVVCRIANRMSCNYSKCKMIYTAHGFHFFKGNSVLKNFIFKNIEKYMAKYTDVLITINKEDFDAAKAFKYKKDGKCLYVPGIGIDDEHIATVKSKREELINELGITPDKKLLLSVGELSVRKNHELVVRALPYLADDIHYVICGKGDKKDELVRISEELGVRKRLHLLGYRTDVLEVTKSCDVFVFPSFQEGLPVALMEAMSCGLPCVSSNIRGNNDLTDNNTLFNVCCEPKELAQIIGEKFESNDFYVTRDMSKYSVKNIREMMSQIYKEMTI